ncbi:hypothetical protein FHR92_005152 [Fontibacillus solani]|uniref:Uncharacterized protein n=1 Tax=Fontibacillus solani TaxID=1572857 RepID=A0A7W3SYS8_9BACL|nr:hypothetical protein [Fontibacillus solani]MBA9088634.1 hypothetical protein [Fontibacillus solani]
MIIGLIGLLVVIGSLMYVIVKQQQVMDKLNNKLMSRNYTEYVSMTKARDDPPLDITSRRPMSWYDDPNIPDVDGDSS